MPKIVIKKRVSLDFLGEEYKDSFLVFQSIPLPDFESISKDMPDVDPRYAELVQKATDQQGELTPEENKELVKLREMNAGANSQNQKMIMSTLKRYFISGKFLDSETDELFDVTDKEDLDGLDQSTAIKCFYILTGQDGPKETSSPTPSPTS